MHSLLLPTRILKTDHPQHPALKDRNDCTPPPPTLNTFMNVEMFLLTISSLKLVQGLHLLPYDIDDPWGQLQVRQSCDVILHAQLYPLGCSSWLGYTQISLKVFPRRLIGCWSINLLSIFGITVGTVDQSVIMILTAVTYPNRRKFKNGGQIRYSPQIF